MPGYTFTVEDQPAQTDLATLNAWIVNYNLAQVGDHWKGRLTIIARDSHNQLVGGLYGFTDRGWLRIEVLVVEERARREGIGSHILNIAETEAQRRGCHNAWLETFSFQALPFYEKQGYRVFGQLENYPNEHYRYFLRKSLRQ